MPRPRSQQICLEDTTYYHCYGRCVRRAFLCGKDEFSGKDYSHRKQWIVNRLAHISEIFAIDICAYAIMSNHYHVVLKVDVQKAQAWDDKTVIKRWHQLFNGNLLTQNYLSGEQLSEAKQLIVDSCVHIWRARLQDISWFMRCLNEYIARIANAEEECTGRFWEGRFKCQALLDETAILTCMSYVDLNPIRAKQANTPEQSDFTSIQQRIHEYNNHYNNKKQDAIKLGKFSHEHDSCIPFHYNDYRALVEWTGRAILSPKHGHISDNLPPILSRLNLEPSQYLNHVQFFGQRFPRVAGTITTLKKFCLNNNLSWVQGMGIKSQECRPTNETQAIVF